MKNRAYPLMLLFLFLSLNIFGICWKSQNISHQVTTESIPSSKICSAAITTINFSGYEWYVKENLGSGEKWGPGPNWWNGSSQNVWVDSQGYLHLKISKVGNEWHCAEIWSKESFGYGQYIFQIDLEIDKMDKNIVLGLFTYYNDTEEIDIEFSKWGDAKAENSQYVVQPASEINRMYRFNTDPQNRTSTHTFLWKSDWIQFRSGFGNISNYNQSIYSQWNFGRMPKPIPRTEKVHLNLWLMKGLPPSNNQEFEVIIERFEFRNLTEAEFFEKPKVYISIISGPGIWSLLLTLSVGIIISIIKIKEKSKNI